MGYLSASDRAKLPNSSFAYVDSRGQRKLPIHDESHVRNALARFDRVKFESEAARERARTRLLNAAKKYGIVPVGFITGQLRAEREHAVAGNEVQARSTDPVNLPSGFVTFLLTDIEGSTALLRQLGDGYAGVLKDVRETVRRAVARSGGREVDARADEFFAVFERPAPAIEAAVSIQRTLGGRTWPDDLECRVRAGIHSGTSTLTDTGYIGLSVNTTARICSIARGGQIVISAETKDAVDEPLPLSISFRRLGRRRLPGMTRPHDLFQVEADGILTDFPPLRRSSARPRNA